MKKILLFLCLSYCTLSFADNTIIEDIEVAGLNRHKIADLSVDDFGNIFFISQYGLFEINNSDLIDHNSYIKHIELYKIAAIGYRELRVTSQDNQDYILNINNKSIEEYLTSNPPQKPLNEMNVLDGNPLIYDWGIKRVKNKNKSGYLIKDTKNLSIKSVIAHRDRLYFACDRGIYRLQNDGADLILEMNGINLIKSINNRLFIATKTALYLLDDELTKLVSDFNIISISKYRDGILLGTQNRGVLLYNKEITPLGLESHFISSIVVSDDKIFAGALKGGLFKFSNGSWEVLSNSLDVTSLLFYKDQLYIGSLYSGLLVYKENKLLRKEGPETVTSINKYGDNIVVCSNETFGLFSINDDLYYPNKHLTDFYGSNIYNSALLYRNKLYIGQTKGLYIFDPLVNTKNEMDIIYSNLTLNSRNRTLTKKVSSDIKLHWPYNSLFFDFKLTPNKDYLRYEYKLKMSDKTLKYKGNRVSLLNLKPGNYKLDLHISTPYRELVDFNKSVNIEVEKPIWVSFTFWSSIIFVTLFITIIFIKIRLNRVKKINKELQIAISEVSDSLISEAQEKERLRIARDLHDSLSQTLFSISLTTETAIEHVPNPHLLKKVNDIKELAQRAQSQMRTLLYELHPAIFNNTALDIIIRRLISIYNEIDFVVIVTEEPKLEVKKEVYRVIQEAINNIVKHSKATRVEIKIGKNSLKIRDNGLGFNSKLKGMGLTVMEERMDSICGKLEIESNREGTLVKGVWEDYE